MSQNQVFHAVYRCRRCAERIREERESASNMLGYLCTIVDDLGSPEEMLKTPDERLVNVHYCLDGGFGVMDLLGVEPA